MFRAGPELVEFEVDGAADGARVGAHGQAGHQNGTASSGQMARR